MVLALSDQQSSRALMIGTSRYQHMAELPSVEENIRDLAALLRDDVRWGLPDENCQIIYNAASPREVDFALRGAASQVGSNGLLLVYYAGHGLVGANRDLYLSLPDTDPDAPYSTAVPFEWLRMSLRGVRAERRLVILDCCYAGRATLGLPVVQDLADAFAADRTCLLLAVAENELAMAPEGERHTAFTGELVDLLTRGLDRGPSLLDIRTIWSELAPRLGRRRLPQPQLRSPSGAEDLPLIRNPALYRDERLGQVLYAAPFVNSDELRQAVVLILRYHRDRGALGVIVNRPTRKAAREVAPEWVELCSSPPVVFDGGPVRHEGQIPLAILREGVEAPLRFTPVSGRLGTVALSAQISTVEDLVTEFRLFSGYFGWAAGELESDIAKGILVTTREMADVVFAKSPDRLWHYLQQPS